LYTVEVTVTDDDGGTRSDSFTVTVGNEDPVTDAGTDQSADEGETMSLDPSTFTDDGTDDTHIAEIDWGDGNVESGTVSEADGSGTVSGDHEYGDDGDETNLGTQTSPVTGQGHTYTSTGTYTVTVTVTDDDGGVDAIQFEITISDTPDDSIPPEAVIYWDPDTREIEVYGIDETDDDVEVTETLISEIENGNTVITVMNYLLEDDAGNTMEIQLEITTVTSSSYKRITAEIEFFNYNDGDDITLGDHFYDVIFTESAGNGDLLFVRQYINFKLNFRVITRWYDRTGETDIYLYPYGEPSSSETLDGLVIVDIRTSAGDIIYHYDS